LCDESKRNDSKIVLNCFDSKGFLTEYEKLYEIVEVIEKEGSRRFNDLIIFHIKKTQTF